MEVRTSGGVILHGFESFVVFFQTAIFSITDFTEEELGRRKGGASFVTCFRFSQAWGMDAENKCHQRLFETQKSHILWVAKHDTPWRHTSSCVSIKLLSILDSQPQPLFNLMSNYLPLNLRNGHWISLPFAAGILMPFGPYLREDCIGWRMSGLRSPRRSFGVKARRWWHGPWTFGTCCMVKL